MSNSRRDHVGNLHSRAERNSFVGRQREMREVRRLLADSRLVTLTGVGGAGKTRLAVHAAADLRRVFPDGAWLIELGQLRADGEPVEGSRDVPRLAFTVQAALGQPDLGPGPPVRMVVDRLADQRMLLILDNCEHLLPASALFADALLRGCPRLRILATSREPLGVGGEAVLPVPPLSMPRRTHRGAPAEAVELFVDRAGQTVPGFALDADSRAAVADICHRVDGLPLAIELAAAWLRVLTVHQIVDRLTDPFALLTRGNRGAPDRQQALRACVDWSYQLCTEPERLLWSRLSVFVDGFELEAAEGVCADELVPRDDVVRLLADLVDKSILDPEHAGDTARYRMLETIRAYGQSRLTDRGGLGAVRRRHRDFYGRLVSRARDEWAGDRQTYWLARLGREHANLRTAVDAALSEPGSAEAALRIATDLPLHYWYTRGAFGEGRRWVDRARTHTVGSTPAHARALLLSGQLAIAQGDAPAAARLLSDGEDLARRLGAQTEIGHAIYVRGMRELFADNVRPAAETLAEAWYHLAAAAETDLDLNTNVLVTLGVAAGLGGDRDRMDLALRELDRIVQVGQAEFYRSAALWIGAIAAFVRGDLDEAATLAVENLRLVGQWAAQNPGSLAVALAVLAWITAARGQFGSAAVLLGAADSAFAGTGSSITAQRHFVGHHEACGQRTRQALGDRAFAEATGRGRCIPVDELIADVLGGQPATPPVPVDEALTRRERQVAGLIAEGRTNKDIAAALVISPRTAESHVEHLLAKLNFTSRAQVAAWVAGRPQESDKAGRS